eukprot:scaffold34769_cov50-Phaeocystis_antarctica.AAC.1
MKQLGLSVLGLRGHCTHASEEGSLSPRRADEGEVRLTCMPFVAPLKIPSAPWETAAIMFGMAEGGGAGGADGEGGGRQQSA